MKAVKKRVPINQIDPNRGQVDGLPSNPRFIRDDRFSRLKKSIEQDPDFLELREVLLFPVGADGETRFVIIAGEMRYRACRDLGMDKVPAKIIPSDTPVEMLRQWAVKDNAHHGEWDMDALANEWDSLPLGDWGIELPDGWLDPEPGEASDDGFVIPPDIETDIEPGDLFQIGQHRLICGDTTSQEVVNRLMGGVRANIVHTDPPYNVDYGSSKNPRHKIRKIENDSLSDEGWSAFCHAIFARIKEHCIGDVYVWGAPGPDGMRMRLWLSDFGCHWSATIIWKKDQLVLSPAKYQRMYEPCFYGWFDKSSYCGDRKQVEVWEVPRPKNSKEHPTMKPIELCAIPIQNSTKPGEVVLDLFGGSGSSMVASHQLGRACYMGEIEPMYCQVIIDRMRKLDPNIEVKKIEA